MADSSSRPAQGRTAGLERLLPLPPDTDVRVYDEPTAKNTAPYVAHYPFHGLDLQLSHYSHRPFSLCDRLAALVFQTYMFPGFSASLLTKTPSLVDPTTRRRSFTKFSQPLHLRSSDMRLSTALDALDHALATKTDEDATPLKRYQAQMWPAPAWTRPWDDHGVFVGWLWPNPPGTEAKVGGCTERRFSARTRHTVGDRMIDLVQRYFLEMGDPEARRWFQTVGEVNRMLHSQLPIDSFHGQARDNWWDDYSRAAGAPAGTVGSRGRARRQEFLRDLTTGARRTRQSLFLFDGFAAHQEPLSDWRVKAMETTVEHEKKLDRDDHWGLASREFEVPWDRGTGRGRLPARRRDADDVRRRRRSWSAYQDEYWVATPGRPWRATSMPAPGEWSTALLPDPADRAENVYFRPMRLSELDRRCRRRSLSRRNILDMFHPSTVAGLHIDEPWDGPSMKSWYLWLEELSDVRRKGYLEPDMDPTEDLRAALLDHALTRRKPYCGYCGEPSHPTDGCPHPRHLRCKCRPFPRHLAHACRVLCSRACGSAFVPGHVRHPNAMTCKHRCCMCGLRGHGGHECRLKRCRCGRPHLGQDCGWNPVCGAKLGSPAGAENRCERYLCGVHCRECGSAEKPFVGWRCGKCLAHGEPARQRQSVFDDDDDDDAPPTRRREGEASGRWMFRERGLTRIRTNQPIKEFPGQNICRGDSCEIHPLNETRRRRRARSVNGEKGP